MIGAIIGDISGSRFEFNRTNRIDFELFTPQCDFTDDTICTVAIADAIMNRNNDFRGALLYWCNRYTPDGRLRRAFPAMATKPRSIRFNGKRFSDARFAVRMVV